MKLVEVHVKAGAKKNAVGEEGGIYKVSVKEPAEDNRANRAVVNVLARYLQEPVRIRAGFRGKRKRVQIG